MLLISVEVDAILRCFGGMLSASILLDLMSIELACLRNAPLEGISFEGRSEKEPRKLDIRPNAASEMDLFITVSFLLQPYLFCIFIEKSATSNNNNFDSK
uniref:Uncharacterized protein n=1 Tax=Opuntia streptacantha TaxID=393608 RepID=A0A7C9EWY0_OPUST